MWSYDMDMDMCSYLDRVSYNFIRLPIQSQLFFCLCVWGVVFCLQNLASIFKFPPMSSHIFSTWVPGINQLELVQCTSFCQWNPTWLQLVSGYGTCLSTFQQRWVCFRCAEPFHPNPQRSAGEIRTLCSEAPSRIVTNDNTQKLQTIVTMWLFQCELEYSLAILKRNSMRCWRCSLIRKLDLYIVHWPILWIPLIAFMKVCFFLGGLSLDTAKYRAKSHQNLSSCSWGKPFWPIL